MASRTWIIILMIIIIIGLLILIYMLYKVEIVPELLNYPIALDREDNIIPIIIHAQLQSLTPAVNTRTDTNGYYTNTVSHTINDPHNVHESYIITGLKNKVRRLMELSNQIDINNANTLGISIDELKNGKVQESLYQIKYTAEQYFNQSCKSISERDLNMEKLQIVLNEISMGNTITSIAWETDNNKQPVSIREDIILALVWERIHHPDNIKNKSTLEISLIDQLLDSIESDKSLGFLHKSMIPVCINGRVSRVLSSLTLLDNDPILREPEKDESEFNNEAFAKAAHILNTNLESDPVMKELYIKSPDSITNEEAIRLTDFENKIKNLIKEKLYEDYSNILSENKINKLIAKAQEGI